MVTLTNHNPDLSDEEIVRMLEAEYGDVYSITTPPDNQYKRHVEFCDIRQAQIAKEALEGIAAKIPTISEVCNLFLRSLSFSAQMHAHKSYLQACSFTVTDMQFLAERAGGRSL